MFMRKLISVFICITIYPFLMLLIFDGFKESAEAFMLFFVFNTLGLIVYGLPISIGIHYLTQLFDRITELKPIAKSSLKYSVSFVLHLLFGFILTIFSLLSAFIFVLVDFILQLTNKKFTYKHVLIAVIFPIIIAFMAYIIIPK